ncbi:hypothetical protein [Haloarcula halobia]|uniref:hypothetical protein n=1 Tax=Haloarcula halobia TaxID=3033388 RepID=UPI0023EB2F43|nr:hypothetical protein [Halomicroarcula sp. XH51]
MGQLDPVAFDIETSGLTEDAVITVTGFAHDLGEWLVQHQRSQCRPEKPRSGFRCPLGRCRTVVARELRKELEDVASFVDERLNGDRHYVTAFNGETWRGGFDLPFCRTRYHRHDLDWPFGDIAYADMMQIVDRFDTGDNSDLVGVYNSLIGNETCDPFDDSAMAVDAFDNGDWGPLLAHNLADIQRTRELALLAGRFVARSDFRMKNLEPPRR